MTARGNGQLRLGPVGVWSRTFSYSSAAAVREALAEIEELGYSAVWYPEGHGKESLSTGGLLLSWSRRLVVGTAIANIHARDPMAAANGARALADAHPGRFVFGLGVSHAPMVTRRGHEYVRPLETMRAYLDGMARAIYEGDEPAEPAPCLIGALAPKMLDLARERTAGAIPFCVPVEHTTAARERLGAGRLLAPELAVLLETDPGKARTEARVYVAKYLSLDNYRNNLLRLGWAESELADGGSNRVVDALVAWGDVEAIRERVRAHLAAGADHVSIQPLPATGAQLDQLRELAPALIDL